MGKGKLEFKVAYYDAETDKGGVKYIYANDAFHAYVVFTRKYGVWKSLEIKETGIVVKKVSALKKLVRL